MRDFSGTDKIYIGKLYQWEHSITQQFRYLFTNSGPPHAPRFARGLRLW